MQTLNRVTLFLLVSSVFSLSLLAYRHDPSRMDALIKVHSGATPSSFRMVRCPRGCFSFGNLSLLTLLTCSFPKRIFQSSRYTLRADMGCIKSYNEKTKKPSFSQTPGPDDGCAHPFASVDDVRCDVSCTNS